ncbi:alpha/beta fold hydrolase [Nocardioides sp.]|uniref:alpha/beta fold hydrolase n=1 Tax=Nocardioides sp. TaxID=35761 RepID=UPI0035664475
MSAPDRTARAEESSRERITSYRRGPWSFDVLDEGPLDGTPVLLLHGFPERASAWRDVAPVLHAAGLRTFAPDQRGYSPGARPTRRRDYAMEELTADAVALIEEIGGPVHVVGHDWGAMIGWLLGAHHADKVRTLTAASVPHPQAFVRALVTSRQALTSWYMAMFQLRGLPERGAREAGGAFDKAMLGGGMTADEVTRFRTEIVAYGALPGALGWYRGMPFAGRAFLARHTTVPTTYLWGDADSGVGRAAAHACIRYVDGPYTFDVIRGGSHWVPTQHADRCSAAILSRIEASDS